ncbi:hypothetical protein OH76DRAFT_1409637 [Lentinus brumalis]|uniref:Uncharacterized protein n=1 Tax=Lentinus brumalis TaxID=2498619 RepID=A0A371CUN8_9APHY|nr:hypothetical protein OH76DRAFT_1409637 [Polyporus brumalis]
MAQGATLEHSRLDHGVIVELLSLWRQRLQAVYVTQTLSLRPPTLRQKYEPQYDHQILSV